MKIKIVLLVITFFTLFLMVACSTEKLPGDEPPNVLIEVEEETFEATLGTYCWSGTCVDTVGPIELLEGKEPITVHPEETITIVMDYKPKPSLVRLEMIKENSHSDVPLIDNQLKAPKQKGIYYYSYGAWWLDEDDPNVSNGDAFYAFVLEVK